MLPVPSTKEMMRQAVCDMPCQIRNAPCTLHLVSGQGWDVLPYRVFFWEVGWRGGGGGGGGVSKGGAGCERTRNRQCEGRHMMSDKVQRWDLGGKGGRGGRG